MSPTADAVLGCLMGGAVGDAVGYQVEFDHLDAILVRWGPLGVRGPEPGFPLVISDDTQMTLFTAEGLARAERMGGSRPYLQEVRSSYLDWYGTQVLTSAAAPVGTLALEQGIQRRRAPGMTCLGALAMGGRGSTQRPINDSKGCGGVMRSAPVGLMPGLISDEAFDLGAGIAALTHGHVEGWTSAGAMSALVCMLTAAPSKKGHGEVGERLLLATCALQAADMAARNGGMQTAALVRHAVHAASLGALCPHDLVEQLDEGWTGDSALAIGVHAALAGVDFSDAIRIAATHSGDSDSTASIAGQLLGARDGSSIVPQEWTAVLDLGKVVERQAALFCAAFGIIADHAPRQDETASSQLHLSGWRRGETILSSALR